MNITKLWSLAASTTIVFALTACSGNPVENNSAVTPKKTLANTKKFKKVTKATKVASATKIVSKKRVVTNTTPLKVNKPTTLARRSVTTSSPRKVAKARPLSRAESRIKKQRITALGKSRQAQAQARLNYARAQARKKYLENQKLKAEKARRANNIRIARNRNKDFYGLDRFVGSQADEPVRSRPVRRVAKARTVQRTVNRTRPVPVKVRQIAKSPKRVAIAQARQRQPVKARSVQRVATRARQPVRTRARQPVRTRSRQPVQVRSRQPVRSRSRQPVRTRAQQPVRARGTQYAAARRKAPVRTAARANQYRNVAKRRAATNRANVRKAVYKRPAQRRISRIDPNTSFGFALSNAAVERTKHRVRYDGKYLKIGYPWGDVPKSIGVCTDVVIRAYRRLGIDLQQEVHKDISQDFYAYPNLAKWGLRKPDPNIDHRRVYNLQAFFKRHKAELPRSRNPRHYKPGDLVTWMVGPNFPHIGVVVNKPSKADPNRLMIAHNIGYGPKIEDILFRFPMTGHYRYTPKNRKVNPSLLFAKTPPPPSVLARQRNNGMTYQEVLQASKILSGEFKARSLNNLDDLLASNGKKGKPQERIMLANLDASILGTGVNQDALNALLK